MSGPTHEEMLAAISKACQPQRPNVPDDPGATREEMAKHWNLSPAETGKRLQAATKRGTLIRGFKYVQNVNGTWRKVPVYRPA